MRPVRPVLRPIVPAILLAALALGAPRALFAQGGRPDRSPSLGASVIGGPDVGQRAPDFTLPWGNKDTTSAGGEPFTLKRDLGKVVVLVFYPRDFTASSTKLVRTLTERYDELFGPLSAVTVVGVSQDPPAMHHSFAAHNDVGFRLLSDEGQRVARKFGTGGEWRAVYVIGPDGRVRWRDLEFDPNSARSYDEIKRAVQEARRQVPGNE
ncbi:MAG TPA: redoxin domain-containing protein [Gemmatimonadales bacterium]|nr:redoxin domain-containing protein [Gemmatimonadales bacterium]